LRAAVSFDGGAALDREAHAGHDELWRCSPIQGASQPRPRPWPQSRSRVGRDAVPADLRGRGERGLAAPGHIG
jgi:hypothetical protein